MGARETRRGETAGVARWALTVGLLGGLFCTVVGGESIAGASETLGQKVRTYLRHHQFQGAVLIGQGNRILVHRGYGAATLHRYSRNTTTTKFRLASMTKEFTAVAILQLEQAGKLALGDPICRYLAGCPSAWQEVTIQECLAQSSGIISFYTNEFPVTDLRAYYSPDQIIALVGARPLLFAPGTQFHYSNTNYVILGRIIELVSGQSYADYLESRIFTPLGMRHSGVLTEAPVAGLATPYNGFDLGGPAAGQWNDATLFSSGGIYSTVNDLFRWTRALLTGSLIPRAVVHELWTPRTEILPGQWYCFGFVRNLFEVGNGETPTVIWHNGALAFGVMTEMLIFPASQVVIIVLSNQGMTDVDAIAVHLARLTLTGGDKG